jgi:hypothetical protein
MGFLILDVAEGVGDHREGERDPSGGLRQRRRPQDDDAYRIVREALTLKAA